MTDDRSVSALSVGGRDPELAEILDKGLDEYNFAATGTSEKDQGSFSVKVTGTDGEIIGGSPPGRGPDSAGSASISAASRMASAAIAARRC